MAGLSPTFSVRTKPAFSAEAHHHNFAIKHPYQPYIAFNNALIVENLKKTFPDVWRDQPVLVLVRDSKGN